LAIGEVARSAGVTVSAVRYYDEIGVISAATRVGGKRRFDRDAVGRVSFIKRSQQAGLRSDPFLTSSETAGRPLSRPSSRNSTNAARISTR
jgi:hypothetical protein